MLCHFCKEEIQDGAIKCKHCGSDLTSIEQSNVLCDVVEQPAISYYVAVLKKYATFSGRARRKEYWFYVLFNSIVSLVLSAFDGVLGVYDYETGIGLFASVYGLAVLLPGVAVCVRRLHDIDKSGWFLLLMLIPLIGWIVLIVYACQDGTESENEYGSNPKFQRA